VLPDVRRRDLFNLWQVARNAGLATASVGLLGDIVACPGGDFCSLANARAIPLAQAIQQRFAEPGQLADIGELRLNISGCVNACGHHHVGHIGVLGVDKHGEEFYQLTLGGAGGREAALGKVIGPAVAAAEVPNVIVRLVENYRMRRRPQERFIDTLKRVGTETFRAAAYDEPESSKSPAYEREAANG
jgi:sulfite reductase (NADPH) hemoprotein beta-component